MTDKQLVENLYQDLNTILNDYSKEGGMVASAIGVLNVLQYDILMSANEIRDAEEILGLGDDE